MALGVVLLAEGALGGDKTFSRVELEILRPTGPDVHLIDPGDAAEVTRAREVLHKLAGAWHGDQRHEPRPGPECVTCEVSRWCPAFGQTEAGPGAPDPPRATQGSGPSTAPSAHVA